jgi:photosystem II stability/assembly factor-like uncharacterized protein
MRRRHQTRLPRRAARTAHADINGGRRSQAAPLLEHREADLYDTGPDDVQVIDARHGWTITLEGAVYRTADAGRHWSVTDPLG